jgi:hypothetical protein
MDIQLATAIDAENPDVGDIALDNGQIYLTPSEAAATLQRIQIKFNFFQGEWFLDRRQGTPWYQRILIKGSNERVNRSIFRQIVEGDPGIASVVSLRYSLNRTTRALTVSFVAIMTNGETLRSDDFGPFIINVRA